MMSRKLRNDLILIAVLLAAAALWFIFASGRLSRESLFGNGLPSDESVVITVDDEEVYSENLSRLTLPVSVDIKGYNGGKNVFIINKNAEGNVELYCVEADCPDKICVETGRISVPDQPIVCLPHRVTARIVRK